MFTVRVDTLYMKAHNGLVIVRSQPTFVYGVLIVCTLYVPTISIGHILCNSVTLGTNPSPQLHPPTGRAESAETDGRQGVLPAPSSSRGSSPPPLPPAPLSTGDPAEETAPAGQGTGEETLQEAPGAVPRRHLLRGREYVCLCVCVCVCACVFVVRVCMYVCTVCMGIWCVQWCVIYVDVLMQ